MTGPVFTLKYNKKYTLGCLYFLDMSRHTPALRDPYPFDIAYLESRMQAVIDIGLTVRHNC